MGSGVVVRKINILPHAQTTNKD